MAVYNRRSVLRAGVVAGGAALLASTAGGTENDATKDLMAAPSLGETWIGPFDAPLTMIEYASPSCSHCADFHADTFPALKREYIDTGKMRFTLREFPLDEPSLAAFMLARCAPGDGYLGMVDVLFERQAVWTKQDSKAELLSIAKTAGFTQKSFDACMQDNSIANGILATRNHASLRLGVDATPTFFINGQKISGSQPVHYFQKLFDALTG